MTNLPYVLELSDSFYTSLLLEPEGIRAYLGTNKGCVEVWDLELKKKIVELRYLIFDEFGEQVPIEEPIINFSAPKNFDVVYAFMGQAAYCIDIELNTIIHQIPVAEKVVWGSVSPILGEVAILSESGYLSRWSPKFIERIGSIEFPFEIPAGYITHDFDESRIILVINDQLIILTNLEGERYTVELAYEPAKELLNYIYYDKNNRFQIIINNDGKVNVDTYDRKIDEIKQQMIIYGGIFSAAQKLRTAISKMDTGESTRIYIKDQRFDRQSRDRYIAEVEALNLNVHHEGNLKDDAKSLDYAFKEYQSSNVQSQSEALSVINSISNRHQIKINYALFAWNLDGPYQLIENARFYHFEAYRRKNLLKKVIYITLVLSFILLLSQIIVFEGLTKLIFVLFVVIQLFLLKFWKRINTNPVIPHIENYSAIRIANYLVLFISVYYFVIYSLADIVEKINSYIPI